MGPETPVQPEDEHLLVGGPNQSAEEVQERTATQFLNPYVPITASSNTSITARPIAQNNGIFNNQKPYSVSPAASRVDFNPTSEPPPYTENDSDCPPNNLNISQNNTLVSAQVEDANLPVYSDLQFTSVVGVDDEGILMINGKY